MATAVRDPGEAESVARTITDPEFRTLGLTTVARAIAGRDPGKADMLLVEAERLADTISDPRGRADAFLAIARSVSES
jgi:hypothetical protein